MRAGKLRVPDMLHDDAARRAGCCRDTEMSHSHSLTASQIRANLAHPVIDSDGHIIEFQPAALSYLREIAGAGAVERYLAWSMRLAPSARQRIDEQLMRTPFCGTSPPATRATAPAQES